MNDVIITNLDLSCFGDDLIKIRFLLATEFTSLHKVSNKKEAELRNSGKEIFDQCVVKAVGQN